MSDDLVKRLRMRVASESDNAICMTAVPNSWLHKEAAVRIEALEAALAEKEADAARLRDVLNQIASWSQSTGLLWWQEVARAALNTPDREVGG